MSQMVTTVIASLDSPSNIKYYIFTIKYLIFTIFCQAEPVCVCMCCYVDSHGLHPGNMVILSL